MRTRLQKTNQSSCKMERKQFPKKRKKVPLLVVVIYYSILYIHTYERTYRYIHATGKNARDFVITTTRDSLNSFVNNLLLFRKIFVHECDFR